jgi:uncharacterized GH25 family protein
MQESKMELMMQGHEIWLETSKTKGEDVELALMYGHNMRQDGIADAKRLKAFSYQPDGSKSDLFLIADETRYLLRFKTNQEGSYAVVVDMESSILCKTKDGNKRGPRSQFKDVTYAGAFHQMAKILCPVGGDGEYHGQVLHGILEAVPRKPWCQVGQDAELQVFYEGKPLAFGEVKAISRKEGKEMALVKADEQGKARIPVTTDGEWMFLVRHKDATKKVADMFDESVFVSTLVMETR